MQAACVFWDPTDKPVRQLVFAFVLVLPVLAAMAGLAS
jgi:hypothetical protein